MTALTRKQVEALLADAPAGPYQYRPRAFDDWGTVREANGHFLCQAKDARYLDEDFLNECRREGRDPWTGTAKLFVAAPDLATALLAAWDRAEKAEAKLAAIEAKLAAIEARGRDRFKQQLDHLTAETRLRNGDTP